MCFDHSDSVPILSEGWRTAKKLHRCDECNKKIQPGDRYNYAAGVGEDGFCSWKICEDCTTMSAFVVAHEIGEGCVGSEARPPLGGGMLRETLGYLGWHAGIAADNYEDGGKWPVLRWEHLDRVRRGPCDPEVDGKYLCELRARVCA